jgi:hypothetical protein
MLEEVEMARKEIVWCIGRIVCSQNEKLIKPHVDIDMYKWFIKLKLGVKGIVRVTSTYETREMVFTRIMICA